MRRSSEIPAQLDFGLLKQRVSIEQVLASRGLLDALTARGHRLVGPCPVHGGDNPAAFVVDRRRNLWRCFTGCDGGGDVVELVRRLDGCGYAEVARRLAGLAGAAPPPQRRRAPTPPPFRPYRRRLYLDPHHPLLRSRQIRPETAARYEVGAWYGRGMLTGCIGVRLHDPDGQPLGYAGRRLQPDDLGKWVFPPRLPKNQLLYGLHRARQARRLVLVEGPWEVLRLAQLGIAAAALLGTHLSARQARLLRDRSQITVLLDGDPAGRRAAHQVARQLDATPVLLEGGRDPADLGDRELRDLLLF